MYNEKNIIKLEKTIRGKMMAIKAGKITPKESEIGKLMNLMKNFDEPLYEQLIKNYKEILLKDNES